jgi:hypothetical protein
MAYKTYFGNPIVSFSERKFVPIKVISPHPVQIDDALVTASTLYLAHVVFLREHSFIIARLNSANLKLLDHLMELFHLTSIISKAKLRNLQLFHVVQTFFLLLLCLHRRFQSWISARLVGLTIRRISLASHRMMFSFPTQYEPTWKVYQSNLLLSASLSASLQLTRFDCCRFLETSKLLMGLAALFAWRPQLICRTKV